MYKFWFYGSSMMMMLNFWGLDIFFEWKIDLRYEFPVFLIVVFYSTHTKIRLLQPQHSSNTNLLDGIKFNPRIVTRFFEKLDMKSTFKYPTSNIVNKNVLLVEELEADEYMEITQDIYLFALPSIDGKMWRRKCVWRMKRSSTNTVTVLFYLKFTPWDHRAGVYLFNCLSTDSPTHRLYFSCNEKWEELNTFRHWFCDSWLFRHLWFIIKKKHLTNC